jgi:hypothetical protein
MSIAIAYSQKLSPADASMDVKEQLSGIQPKMVIFFASSAFDQQLISQEIQAAFPAIVTFGCSTAGEIVSGKMLKNAVVAMAFDEDSLADVQVQVVEDISSDDSIKKALASFEQHYGEAVSQMDYRQYAGIVLMDGLSLAEENFIERLGDMTNVAFIGGSAGDDLKFEKTYVYSNGRAYSHAAVLALLRPNKDFAFVKTQSFSMLDKTLTATKVISETREVVEFNNKPAAVAYAEALGVSVQEASDKFMSNPVGLVAHDEVFVRSPQQLKGNNMAFYCNIIEGMEVELLNSEDIITDTRNALNDKIKEFGEISGIINFNCILRTLELEAMKQTEAYAEVFSEIPTIGFSTYGEAFYGHINQTATMLLFK